MRADSRFYKVLLNLLVMRTATSSQGIYSVLLALLYFGFVLAGLRVRQSRVYTRHSSVVWVVMHETMSFFGGKIGYVPNLCKT